MSSKILMKMFIFIEDMDFEVNECSKVIIFYSKIPIFFKSSNFWEFLIFAGILANI